jgi:hypothetical protein
MRGVRKLLLALALSAVLAAGLAACGGDSGDPTSSASTGDSTVPAQGSPPATQKPSPAASAEGAGRDELSYSFRTPGGDNSIQTYGQEADAGERDEATVVLAAYLDSRAKGDWVENCGYLAKAAVAPLRRLAATSPRLKGKGCGELLAELEGRVPASSRVSMLAGPIVSLREEGDHGFALFHGPHGSDYFIPMSKEDGKWKVGALAPSEFP